MSEPRDPTSPADNPEPNDELGDEIEDQDDDGLDDEIDPEGLEIDDDEIREEIVRRALMPRAEGRQWRMVTQSAESVTIALDTKVGCLVRVIAWGLDGAEHHTTTWCPGVSLKTLRTAS